MKYKQQLRTILKKTRMTQRELALKLGVTIVALNRWLNNKSVPRKRAMSKINKLYDDDVVGERVVTRKKQSMKKKGIVQRSFFDRFVDYIWENR